MRQTIQIGLGEYIENTLILSYLKLGFYRLTGLSRWFSCFTRFFANNVYYGDLLKWKGKSTKCSLKKMKQTRSTQGQKKKPSENPFLLFRGEKMRNPKAPCSRTIQHAPTYSPLSCPNWQALTSTPHRAWWKRFEDMSILGIQLYIPCQSKTIEIIVPWNPALELLIVNPY